MAPFVPLLKQWRKAVVIDYCLNERWQVPVVTGTPGAGADSCHLGWQMRGWSYKRPEPEWWLWVCRGPTDTTQEKERETQTHSHTTGARAGASEPWRSRSWLRRTETVSQSGGYKENIVWCHYWYYDLRYTPRSPPAQLRTQTTDKNRIKCYKK